MAAQVRNRTGIAGSFAELALNCKALFAPRAWCYRSAMASLQDMTDAELIALYEEIDADSNPELLSAVLAEIERRNLDI